MTHIFKKSFLGHRSRSAEEELVLAINPTNGRILNYQQTTNLKKLSFPLVSYLHTKQTLLALTNFYLRKCLKNTILLICAMTW